MDNYNIRQDRPRLSSQEIEQQKDFDTLLNDYNIMKKPFYKNPWFFGVTGMASLGLLIGTSYSFTDRPAEPPLANLTTESTPPQKLGKTIYLASAETFDSQDEVNKVSKPIENKVIKLKKKETHDNNSTLKKNTTKTKLAKPAERQSTSVVMADQRQETHNAAMQNHPKIDGKYGGDLSQGNVSNQTVISTDSDISVIGFEMHCKTEFGSKVLKSNSNRLTDEMVSTLKSADPDNDVFFEAIKGAVNSEKWVHLSPLKFNLVK